MITIIKHGQKTFEARCTTCDCVFQYNLNDITCLEYITCPDCGSYVLHNSRIKDIEKTLTKIEEIRSVIAEGLAKITSDVDKGGEAYRKLVDQITFLVETGLEKGNDEL